MICILFSIYCLVANTSSAVCMKSSKSAPNINQLSLSDSQDTLVNSSSDLGVGQKDNQGAAKRRKRLEGSALAGSRLEMVTCKVSFRLEYPLLRSVLNILDASNGTIESLSTR